MYFQAEPEPRVQFRRFYKRSCVSLRLAELPAFVPKEETSEAPQTAPQGCLARLRALSQPDDA